MKAASRRKRLLAGTLLGALTAVASAFATASDGRLGSIAASRAAPSADAVAGNWDAKAAAAYLDQRANWWITWKNAARDHGTFCVSCHTAVPYLLSRPALGKVLAEAAPNENERAIIDNVTKRVRLWKEIAPVYNDKDYGANKEVESRATEAVLLAFVLANRDAQVGKLSGDTRAAFDNLWAQQQTGGPNKGGWFWQMFDMNPWEGTISAYHGATLAAIAVGVAPDGYGSTAGIQKNVAALRDYLNRDFSTQPLVNRATLLWAGAKLPGLVAPDRQKAIIEQLLREQREDGGWSLFPMAKTWRDWSPSVLAGEWKRHDGTPQDLNSDGYATGLAVFVLQQAGVSRDDARVQRGRTWLVQHQNKAEGFWYTASINKHRDPASNVGRFMSDAATAYAVLALTQ